MKTSTAFAVAAGLILTAGPLIAGTTYVDNIVVSNSLSQKSASSTNSFYGPLLLTRQGDLLTGTYTGGVSCGSFLNIANLSAVVLSTNSVRLRGDLLDVGGENPSVYVYWGTNDGAAVKANWGNVSNLGVKTLGIVSNDVAGLASDTIYYYRFYASNSLAERWASPTFQVEIASYWVPAWSNYSAFWHNFEQTNAYNQFLEADGKTTRNATNIGAYRIVIATNSLGRVEYGVNLDGVDDYCRVYSSSNAHAGCTAITYLAWVKQPKFYQFGTPLGCNEGGSGNNKLQLWNQDVSSGTNHYFYATVGSNVSSSAIVSSQVWSNKWVCWAFRWNQAQKYSEIFTNGQPAAMTASNNYNGTLPAFPYNYEVGRDPYYWIPIGGVVGDVQFLTNYFMSNAEIAEYYTNTVVTNSQRYYPLDE